MENTQAEKAVCCGPDCKDGGCCGSYACNCVHHMVIPILVVAFGATFLMGQLGFISEATVSIVWPILVMMAGLKKLFAGLCKCC